jgi:hypothetical protein
MENSNKKHCAWCGTTENVTKNRVQTFTDKPSIEELDKKTNKKIIKYKKILRDVRFDSCVKCDDFLTRLEKKRNLFYGFLFFGLPLFLPLTFLLIDSSFNFANLTIANLGIVLFMAIPLYVLGGVIYLITNFLFNLEYKLKVYSILPSLKEFPENMTGSMGEQNGKMSVLAGYITGDLHNDNVELTVYQAETVPEANKITKLNTANPTYEFKKTSFGLFGRLIIVLVFYLAPIMAGGFFAYQTWAPLAWGFNFNDFDDNIESDISEELQRIENAEPGLDDVCICLKTAESMEELYKCTQDASAEAFEIINEMPPEVLDNISEDCKQLEKDKKVVAEAQGGENDKKSKDKDNENLLNGLSYIMYFLSGLFILIILSEVISVIRIAGKAKK